MDRPSSNRRGHSPLPTYPPLPVVRYMANISAGFLLRIIAAVASLDLPRQFHNPTNRNFNGMAEQLDLSLEAPREYHDLTMLVYVLKKHNRRLKDLLRPKVERWMRTVTLPDLPTSIRMRLMVPLMRLFFGYLIVRSHLACLLHSEYARSLAWRVFHEKANPGGHVSGQLVQEFDQYGYFDDFDDDFERRCMTATGLGDFRQRPSDIFSSAARVYGLARIINWNWRWM